MEQENIKLTAKEERFCELYVLYLNATRAAKEAGYSEKTASEISCENLTKPKIKNRISELQNNLSQAAQISALRIIKEHEKIAFSSIAHLHKTWIEREDFEKLTKDQKDCIKSIKTKISTANKGTKDEPMFVDVEFVHVELWDKQKSLEALERILGAGNNNKPQGEQITQVIINNSGNIKPFPSNESDIK